MIGLFVIAAAAQPQLAPPSVIVPAPIPPLSATAAIDPPRLAAAARLLDAIHVEQQYDGMFKVMIPIITSQLFATLPDNMKVPAPLRAELAKPERNAEAQRMFAAEAMAGFQKRYPALKAATAREYAALFDTDELQELAIFYESLIGRKALTVLPQLQAKLAPIGMAAGRAVGEEAMRRMVEQLGLEPGKPKT